MPGLMGGSADLSNLYMFVVYNQNSHGGRGKSECRVPGTEWLETAKLKQVFMF